MTLPTITPEKAKHLLARGGTLIDIRDPGEHARERIPGSLNVPLTSLTSLERLPAPILFHCRAGKRTADNAERLKQAACCEAYIVEGGIEAWKQAGFDVAGDRGRPIDINRQVMIAAGTIILLGALGYSVAPYFYALTAFMGAGLVFAGVSGWCGLAKLLGLMPWNRRSIGA